MLKFVHKRATVGQVSSDGGRLRVVLSTESEDRSGDIVRVKGWRLAAYKRNPIVLFGHRGDQIVGTADVSVEDRLVADITLAEPGTAPVVDYVRSLIRQNILKAASAGFRAIKYAYLDNGGVEFIEQELLECSLVGVPANPEALAIAKQFGLSQSDFVVSDEQPAATSTPDDLSDTEKVKLRLWIQAQRLREYCPANVGERK